MSTIVNQLDRIAVVDLETTGFAPRVGHRVVEIAIVTSDGNQIHEFETLVDPGRHISARDIHGVDPAQLVGAPEFGDLIGDIAEVIADRIVVAHNAVFDLRFLAAEFERAGYQLPAFAVICTLDHTRCSLGEACQRHGIAQGRAHAAMDDARATHQLLVSLMARGQLDGIESWVTQHTDGAAGWPTVAASHRTLPRPAALAAIAQRRGALARLIEEFGPGLGTGNVGSYLALLDEVLLDRRVTPEEVTGLKAIADELGLSGMDLNAAHGSYLGEIARVAAADGVLTEAERTDLVDVAGLLGLPDEFGVSLSTALIAATAGSAAPTAASGMRPRIAPGASVCFTGELLAAINGERITRGRAGELATAAGFDVRDSVTKGLDVLVVADPDTRSSKAEKARRYGTMIFAEPVFWAELGFETD